MDITSFGGESSGIDVIIRSIILFRISVKLGFRAPDRIENLRPTNPATLAIAMINGNRFIDRLPFNCCSSYAYSKTNHGESPKALKPINPPVRECHPSGEHVGMCNLTTLPRNDCDPPLNYLNLAMTPCSIWGFSRKDQAMYAGEERRSDGDRRLADRRKHERTGIDVSNRRKAARSEGCNRRRGDAK